ncbi:site-specific integrase [Bacillus pacificus]|uniref:Site-specific integrase n=1 Tax=Bacillus pacificus TaxID=2026187 RepID=A0AAW6YQM0_9BACI|nr:MULTISPECIES: site-specific integrase [Bacillus cereus group]EEL74533.1 Phage integrase [Bacillus cereus AH676]KMP41277.1 integrase [Bacillus cereus]MBL3819928.1 site-specific integrase [Bacillus cereus]MDA1589554.1 site-specific integrase [Bacillus cereus group sp. TH225LC]MDA1682947.1 site-specific integrase [Bacillus cereus group sp. m2-21]
MNKFKIVNNNTCSKINVLDLDLEKFQYKLIEDWERQQVVKGFTKETVALNLRNIDEFIKFNKKYVWEISAEDVEKFYYSLVGKGLSHSTRRKYQSNISTFYSFLKSRKSLELYNSIGVLVPEVIDEFNKFFHRKDDDDVRVIPPKKEILDMFFNELKSRILTSRKYYTVARDYVFFKTLSLSGLRINELVMLDINDLRFDLGHNGKIHVRYGKGSRGTGHKPRWVPMLSGLDKLLEWYLEEILPGLKNNQVNAALFLSEAGERVGRDTMRSNLIRRQKEIGIPKSEQFSAHQLRHAFATNYVELGVDILTMSKLLGHSNVSTTAGYLEPSSNFIENRIRLAQNKWKSQLEEVLREEKNEC